MSYEPTLRSVATTTATEKPDLLDLSMMQVLQGWLLSLDVCTLECKVGVTLSFGLSPNGSIWFNRGQYFPSPTPVGNRGSSPEVAKLQGATITRVHQVQGGWRIEFKPQDGLKHALRIFSKPGDKGLQYSLEAESVSRVTTALTPGVMGPNQEFPKA